MNLKQQIREALKNPDFPDLNFLYSEVVLDVAEELLEQLLEEEKSDFSEKLKTPDTEITFETFEDFSYLDYFFSLLEHYQGVNNDEKIRKIIENFEPKYIDFSNEVAYSKRYYDMLKIYIAQNNLNGEQLRILKRSIEAYETRGIALDPENQTQLKKINKDLSDLALTFGNNVLDSQNEFEYIITDPEIIAEMPQDDKEVAKQKYQDKKLQPHLSLQERVERGVTGDNGVEKFLFDASGSSYMSIMKYCSDSNVRKHFYEARNCFATEGEKNNKKIIVEILKLRQEKAEILGFKNYGELSLHFKMAESPEQVIKLFGEIADKARPKAQAELDEIKNYFELSELNPWDLGYYARKLREEKYALDDRELKKYFQFEKVLAGMFEIVNKLYGIEMKHLSPTLSSQEREQAAVSSPLGGENGERYYVGSQSFLDDTQVYEVYKDGKFLSYFHTDFFYRPLKRQGAWANILREKYSSKKYKKLVVNVCNFQKGADGTTLLTLSDVETMFHEFGHAIHEMLSQSEYSELSGFHVEHDFIELPSQIMENWCRHPEGLSIFAKHVETGEKIPKDMLQKLEQLETFGNGQFVLKQNEYAMMDMSLHIGNIPSTEQELDTVIQDNFQKNSLFKLSDIYNPHTSFTHIFDGGYAAGYYSYMWAEIIEKEVWKVFVDSGNIFSPDISQAFLHTILSQGSTKKASELFHDFANRDPEIEAFLYEKGLQ